MLIAPPVVKEYNPEELITVKALSEKYGRLTDFIYKRLIKYNVQPKAMHRTDSHLVRLYLLSECRAIFENNVTPEEVQPPESYIELTSAIEQFENSFNYPNKNNTYHHIMSFFLKVFNVETMVVGNRVFVLRQSIDWIIQHFKYMVSQEYEK